jgi:ATP-dependent Clp protease protease subunit
MINKKIPVIQGNIHPMIYEKTRDGEMLYDVFSRLIKDRVVFLSDEITGEVGTTIAATLLFLDNQSSTKEISLYVNSPGGTVCDGLFTIYDTMQYIKAPIKTVCIGEACSAAAVLLSAGTPGKRYAFPNATIMIHEIQIGELSGTGTHIEKEAKRIKVLNDKILSTVAKHCSQTLEKVKSDCKEDFYLTAEEALAYGLIDSIVKPNKPIPVTKKLKKTSLEDEK